MFETQADIICPCCGPVKSRVTDTRDWHVGDMIARKRRRKCLGCDYRAVTLEFQVADQGVAGHRGRQMTAELLINRLREAVGMER